MNSNIEKRTWTKEETLAFLSAYGARKGEFENTKKKKYAMDNVLTDLESQGSLTQPTTKLMLQAKLKNLLRAWKAAKDSNNRTGAAPCIAPYMMEMEELFGNSPIISNAHTINLHGNPISQLLVPGLESTGLESPIFSISETPVPSSDSPQQASNSLPHVPLTPAAHYREKKRNSTALMKIKQKQIADKKLEAYKEYTEKKLKLMQDFEDKKHARHKEKMDVINKYRCKCCCKCHLKTTDP